MLRRATAGSGGYFSRAAAKATGGYRGYHVTTSTSSFAVLVPSSSTSGRTTGTFLLRSRNVNAAALCRHRSYSGGPPSSTAAAVSAMHSWRMGGGNNNAKNPSSASQMQQTRDFFFGNSGKDGDDDDDDKKNGKKKNEKDDDVDGVDSGSGERDDDFDTDLMVASANAPGRSRGGNVVLPATRLGVGDQAPRYPHLLALPVVRGPLFPGTITSVVVNDPATVKALEKIASSGTGGYVGVFLRRDKSSGVSRGGVILDRPEIIGTEDDLHSVGGFAQVLRFTKIPSAASSHGLQQSHGTSPSSAPLPSPPIPPTSTSTTTDAGSEEETPPAASLLLYAHRRIDLQSVDNVGPPVDVTVTHWDRQRYIRGDDPSRDDTIRALCQEVLSAIREVAKINSLFREQVANSQHVDMNDPYKLADFAASLSNGGDPEDLQAVLEERDVEMRLQKALVLLTKEREVSKLQQEISAKVEEKLTEAQRKHFLMEQLKSIKKELGMEKDDKDTLIEKYRAKIDACPKIPTDVSEAMESELAKLATLEKNSSEFNVTRSYLDWLTSIPWGVTSAENFDVAKAREVLDRDHYGMDELKDTILQFIAVGKLKGTVQGKILCLVGPPGTGKTSIAESVAEALGRKFFRFSVGGMSDVSEIKGHRRTYVGAMPGKIIQCLKQTGSTNPLVLIDEIDKLGRDFRGDPASALLEVLDPSQNSTFRDHFVDVPVDVSKILFVCTANELDKIPSPLLDRMEVIRLSGYDFNEKIEIAEKYLVPKSMVESGLMVKDEEKDTDGDSGDAQEKKEGDAEEEKKDEVSFASTPTTTTYHPAEGVPETISLSRSAIESLVRWYCREAGVRNLAKKIDKVTRLLSLQIVAESEGAVLTEKSRRKSDSWEVSADNLHEYVGKPIFTSDRLYEKDPLPHGIVMGLAWTSMGGTALYIETQGIKRGLNEKGKRRGGGTLKVTGQLGDVMKESTQIAYTVARARLAEIAPNNSYFDDTDVHMHVPEGAIKKDGPSAGVTMVTAMMSLALDRPVKSDLAMTGEISLTGKVMAVGGIKEKTMAARRAGIKTLVLPQECQRDFDELPEYLKEGLDVHYASEYSDVFTVALEHAS